MKSIPIKLKKKKTFILAIISIFIINGFITPIPRGTSYKGKEMQDTRIKFLYDLSYVQDEKSIREQNIFNAQLELIEDAEEFIILDMFLFNDDYNRKFKMEYPSISRQLTDSLIEKKRNNPNMKILFITDEINNYYGLYKSPYIGELEDHGIHVIITELENMRDSNPIYSGIWRTGFKWFPTAGKGWLPNPFRPDAKKFTLRGYLKLLNFKANHRKIIVSEKDAIISSMNPHDASGYHSNIGFKINGNILYDIILSEMEVARLSGYDGEWDFKPILNSNETQEELMVANLITEGKIRHSIIEEIENSHKGDKITIGMFYLSHRGIIKGLIDAANQGVDVKIVLDPNKDAFGIQKNGIPNRQVAYELKKKSKDSIEIRWYDTHGEQFHSKILLVEKKDKAIIIGGSANMTRRNINDYNLESNIRIETSKNSQLYMDVVEYFNRIWNNKDGQYTIEYDKYSENSPIKSIIYRFQEWSGMCTY